MSFLPDRRTLWVLGGVVAVLVPASFAGFLLARRVRQEEGEGRSAVDDLNARLRSWWTLTVIFLLAFLAGPSGAMALFAFVSLLALREYLSLIPTTRADHRTLFWSYFVFTPLKYWFWYRGWYSLAVLFIPVYAFLFVPIRLALAGDATGFLDRAARIQWGLMICVYCISYAPALLTLGLPRFQNARLLLFLVIVAQAGQAVEYVWREFLSRKKRVLGARRGMSWGGFLGGVAASAAAGTALGWMTPFSWPQALLLSLAIALMGFAGSLTLAAIRRDRGVRDFADTMEGSGGILDRMDSICFAAPLFFHLTRWMLAGQPAWWRF